ncbi:MAG TPA: ATP synthase subunit I [Smithella sp.]|nr:ATP synthase subunit I [Smithella sp.]HPX30261.1 ATP synthase subunit I [Smithella sp.]HQC17867.1 ATP synthase subunit I [Smithella sp.]HQN70150.1 ATP synthase subunit I [Smithella sp.]HQP40175.1 ATP synthase subunit I [Smithella sp.]
MNLIVKDPLQKRIEITNWIILAVIFIPSLFLAPLKFSLGILLGGFVSIVNFHWMARGLRGIFQNLQGNPKGTVMVKYYIRLAIMAVVLYLLIANNVVDIVGLLIGLSVVIINILVTMIIALAKKNFIEEVV